MSGSSLSGWMASMRCMARLWPRSPAGSVAIVGALGVFLASRAAEHGAFMPSALINPAAAADAGAHAAAALLGLSGPVTALSVVLVGEQTLLERRRALYAVFPDLTASRAAQWAISACALATGATALAVAYPVASGILASPFLALAWILPAAMAASGLQVLVAEAVREPLAGCLTGGAWLLVSYVAENVPALRPPEPVPLLMLTPATVYPPGASLWHSSAVTMAVAIILWMAALAVAGHYRARGWDV